MAQKNQTFTAMAKRRLGYVLFSNFVTFCFGNSLVRSVVGGGHCLSVCLSDCHVKISSEALEDIENKISSSFAIHIWVQKAVGIDTAVISPPLVSWSIVWPFKGYGNLLSFNEPHIRNPFSI